VLRLVSREYLLIKKIQISPPLSFLCFYLYFVKKSKPIMNTYFHFLSIKTCHNKKRHSNIDKKSNAIIDSTRKFAFCTRAANILSGVTIDITDLTWCFALGTCSWLGARAQSLRVSHDWSWDQKSNKQKNQEVFKVHFCWKNCFLFFIFFFFYCFWSIRVELSHSWT